MNLNFYNPNNANNLESLQSALQEQINKLDQLRNMSLKPQVNQPLQEQRYYVDCGKKEEWDQFLKLNYGITEEQIFSDYRLFLQAKEELNQDTNKEKLEEMKRKIAPKRIKENASNIATANNQPPNVINTERLEEDNKRNENKGVKYVR